MKSNGRLISKAEGSQDSIQLVKEFIEENENKIDDKLKSNIYYDEGYETFNTDQVRTRGNCTDIYTKAWCDSHGYANNRPVSGSVTLTNKESDGYWKWVANMLRNEVVSLITVNIAEASFELCLCLR